MSGILIDSDIVIELLRGRNDEYRLGFESLLGGVGPLCFSAVTVAEIGQGARLAEGAAISALFGFMICMPADCGVAEEAGKILNRFRKSHALGLGDALIAATAIRSDLVLWTRNRKHYPDERLRFLEGSARPTPS